MKLRRSGGFRKLAEIIYRRDSELDKEQFYLFLRESVKILYTTTI